MLEHKNFTKFEIRVGDINYGGHMGNDKALLLFHDARIRFLKTIGCTEKDIGNGTGIIMTEAHVYFLKEIFLHDILSASVSVSDVSTAAFAVNYSFTRESDGKEVLKGSTKILAYDYQRQKVARIPDGLVEIFVK